MYPIRTNDPSESARLARVKERAKANVEAAWSIVHDARTLCEQARVICECAACIREEAQSIRSHRGREEAAADAETLLLETREGEHSLYKSQSNVCT